MRRTEVETAQRTGAKLFKQFTTRAEPLADRRVRFVATTSDPDREGDRIMTEGIDTSAFERNPVVPFAHSYHDLPVGRAVKIERQPDRLLLTVEFAPAEANPLAQQVLDLVRGGFLNAMSIGFRPIEWRYNEERSGVDFYKTELLEASIVPIPANAGALIAASARGIDVSVVRAWAGRVLREGPMQGRDNGPGLAIRDEPERVAVDTAMLADTIADAVHDVVAKAVRRAINDAAGRIDDSDTWVPPRRSAPTPTPRLGGGIGRMVFQTESGLSVPGAFRR